MATNVTGLINMTQAILPIFKARGSDGGAGDIINVGSIAGREPYPGGSIYCATKAAVRSFTDALRRELIASRVRVIEIDPGQVETEFSVVRFYGDKSAADKVYEGCEPLTPDDIAEVVVFSAGRRENVVIADTLIFPNHQVSVKPCSWKSRGLTKCQRPRLLSCTRKLLRRLQSLTLRPGWCWWRPTQEAGTKNLDRLGCSGSLDINARIRIRLLVDVPLRSIMPISISHTIVRLSMVQ